LALYFGLDAIPARLMVYLVTVEHVILLRCQFCFLAFTALDKKLALFHLFSLSKIKHVHNVIAMIISVVATPINNASLSGSTAQ
jgi:hypothetical protein